MKNCTVKETGYDSEKFAFYGNKFLVGNGYMGVRGTLSEYSKKYLPAINLAGVYDKVGDGWRESVNAPNGLYAYVELNGKKYAMPDVSPKSHEIRLDIYNGDFELSVVRVASMSNKHLILEQTSIISEFEDDFTFFTGIDGDVWDINGPHFSELTVSEIDDYMKVQGITQRLYKCNG